MATLIGACSTHYHPAQNIAHDQLMPIINAQIEAALMLAAVHFPKKKRAAMIKEWRKEIYVELADHYGQDAGYDEIQFIKYS